MRLTVPPPPENNVAQKPYMKGGAAHSSWKIGQPELFYKHCVGV